MYNESIKNAFLDRIRTAKPKSETKYIKLFKDTEIFERRLNKDLALFSKSNLLIMYYDMAKYHKKDTIDMYNTLIKQYKKSEIVYHSFENPNKDTALESDMVFINSEVQNVIFKIEDILNMDTINIADIYYDIYKLIVKLIFSTYGQASLKSILNVSFKDIDFENELLVINNLSYSLNLNTMNEIKNYLEKIEELSGETIFFTPLNPDTLIFRKPSKTEGLENKPFTEEEIKNIIKHNSFFTFKDCINLNDIVLSSVLYDIYINNKSVEEIVETNENLKYVSTNKLQYLYNKNYLESIS